jgi:hypothetical protein
MHDLFVEKHSFGGRPLSWHLARHIYSHGPQGKIAVVTDSPEALLAATRKQWHKLLRQTQNERSSTLNPTRIDMLTGQILWMQGLSFTSKAPDDLLEADITFATVDDFVHVPPVCQCIYVTYNFEREKLYMLTAWMPRNSLVVVYEQG